MSSRSRSADWWSLRPYNWKMFFHESTRNEIGCPMHDWPFDSFGDLKSVARCVHKIRGYRDPEALKLWKSGRVVLYLYPRIKRYIFVSFFSPRSLSEPTMTVPWGPPWSGFPSSSSPVSPSNSFLTSTRDSSATQRKHWGRCSLKKMYYTPTGHFAFLSCKIRILYS